MNGNHFIDSFSREAAFAIEIMAGIRNRKAVDIQPRLPRVDGGEARAGCALHADADPRLQNAISFHHSVCLRIDDSLVQRMRQSPYHAVRRSPGKLRIRIEGDYEPNFGENR